MKNDLKGHLALILGGTAIDGFSSIGAAIANFLRDEGMIAVPSSRDHKKVGATLERLDNTWPAEAPKMDVLAFDTRDTNALRNCVEWIETNMGTIDVLVNAQGINVKKPTVDMTPSEWESIIGVNLTSLSIACQIVGERMLSRGHGHIINIASETSLLAFPNVAAYGASKGGVRALTAGLAVEWARNGLCINAIAPGLFVTALNRPIFASDPDRLEKIVMATPALRLGDTDFEDLRAATIFLATCTTYVNGITLPVDGGMSIAAFT